MHRIKVSIDMSLILFVFIADLTVYLIWTTQALDPAAVSVELCVPAGWMGLVF